MAELKDCLSENQQSLCSLYNVVEMLSAVVGGVLVQEVDNGMKGLLQMVESFQACLLSEDVRLKLL